jgi:cytochrome d ubiquinol oxidase subunit I
MSLTLYLVIYSFLLIAYIRTLFVMANRAVILEQSNATLTESGSSIEPQVPLTEEGAK